MEIGGEAAQVSFLGYINRIFFAVCHIVREEREIAIVAVWVLLYNIDAHNINVTGRVCYLK
jgi:hypothetical protein